MVISPFYLYYHTPKVNYSTNKTKENLSSLFTGLPPHQFKTGDTLYQPITVMHYKALKHVSQNWLCDKLSMLNPYV